METQATQKKVNEEEVDTSTFMNNNPFLVFADWFWTYLCSPVFNLIDRVSEKFTSNWVKNTIADHQADARAQQKQMQEALVAAEEYRKNPL